MIYLKKINELFISENEDKWITSEDEISDYFTGLSDLECPISIGKFWITEKLDMFSRVEKPGYYPGFIIVVTSKFNVVDLEKNIKYLQEILDSKNKLEHYYDKSQISSDRNNEYKFTFLDKNWESITWDEDLVYIEEFLSKYKNPPYLQFGSYGMKKHNKAITIEYSQPVSKKKSDINLIRIKEDLKRFPNHEFEITEDTEKSTGLQKNILVNSVTITCKGKKKS